MVAQRTRCVKLLYIISDIDKKKDFPLSRNCSDQIRTVLRPWNLRLDCGWPNIARPALRCATNLSVVRWLCRSEFKRVFSMQNSLRSPRPQGTGRNAWETADALERHGGFSVVPVLSQSKTGTTVLSCGNVSEYTFSECTFSEGRRCWSRQPDMQASALPAF